MKKPTITDDTLDAYFAKITAPPLQEELFPDDAPPPAPAPSPRWRGCPVCGAKEGGRAHPEHDVCTGCVRYPSAIREHLEGQRRGVLRQQNEAAARAQAAYDALSENERGRWTKICELRAKVDIQDASTEERALLARTLLGLKAPDDERFTPALRAVFTADEHLFWANAANEGMQRQVDVKLAQLAVCLEDLATAA